MEERVTTVAIKQPTILTLPARAAAVAWMNAFSASGQDEERPALYRSLSLEFFPGGAHLVGCDGTVLFRTWVPRSDGAAWPEMDEAPESAVVVIDVDGFGLGFMRSLLRATNDDVHLHESLTFTVSASDNEAAPALGTEFLTQRLVLRACGQRLDLRLFEAAYPDWRRLRLGMETIERLESLTVAPRMFALLGKLKGVSAIDLEFYGASKHVAFVGRGECEVRGLVMPMRKPEQPIER